MPNRLKTGQRSAPPVRPVSTHIGQTASSQKHRDNWRLSIAGHRPATLAAEDSDGGPCWTRTSDQRIMSPSSEIQNERPTNGLQQDSNTLPANSPATDPNQTTDPALTTITQAWDALPDHIRAAIVTLVNSAAREAKE